MDNKHTPGPWHVSDILDNGMPGVITGDNSIIIGTPNRLTIEDKRLIAAAPELLEALRALALDVEQCARSGYHVAGGSPELFDAEFEDADHEQWKLWKNALSAIAKAEGR